MESRKTLAKRVDRFIDLLNNGRLQPEQADELYRLGREAVQLVLLTVNALNAEAVRPSTDSLCTPSGQKPPYEKPNQSKGKSVHPVPSADTKGPAARTYRRKEGRPSGMLSRLRGALESM